MKKAFLTILAATAAFGFATPALAQATVTFDDGNGGLGVGETSYATFSPGSDGGVSGSLYVIQSGSNGAGADPAVGGQGDPYLTVVTGGTANFTFADGLTQLGMDYGSADIFNTFTLLFSSGGPLVFTGQQLINIGTADGDQESPRTNGRLTFFADPGVTITGLQLSSSQNSLEVDNFGIISAVPEPGTWAMMLLGFGAIGGAMRRRRRPAGIPAIA